MKNKKNLVFSLVSQSLTEKSNLTILTYTEDNIANV